MRTLFRKSLTCMMLVLCLFPGSVMSQDVFTASDGSKYQVIPPEPTVLDNKESRKIGLNCEILRISLMKQVKTCTWTGEVIVSDDGVITEISGGKSSEEERVMIRMLLLIIIALMIVSALLMVTR